jgi:hypothetical protein
MSMKSSNRILRSSLVLSAATAAAGSASAEVIYSGPVNLSIYSSTPLETPGYFDLTGDSVNDYKFLFSANNASKPTLTSAAGDFSRLVLVDLNGTTDAGSNGFPVTPAGVTIDAAYLNGGSYWEGWFYNNYDNQVSGDWYSDGFGATGYVGLAVPGDLGINYGWAQMNFDPFLNALTLIDFAYETTPNTGIVTGAVPEPSSIALMATGAAGLLALRARRRKAA